jgi:hypothetical protein
LSRHNIPAFLLIKMSDGNRKGPLLKTDCHLAYSLLANTGCKTR